MQFLVVNVYFKEKETFQTRDRATVCNNSANHRTEIYELWRWNDTEKYLAN